MDNLRVIERNNQIVVGSIEVAEKFEKRHDHIMRDIENLIPQNWGVKEMFMESEYQAGNGQYYKMYLMNRDGFSLLAMGFTGEKALKWKIEFINAFNKMEEKIKESLPQSLPEALRAYADEVEKNEQLQIENNEMKPKAIFADAVSTADTTILVGELAKLIKQNDVPIGQNKLFQWMRENGYLIKRNGMDYNMPTQRAMELELFKIKERSILNPDGSVRLTKTTMVTGKGQQYFINKFL